MFPRLKYCQQTLLGFSNMKNATNHLQLKIKNILHCILQWSCFIIIFNQKYLKQPNKLIYCKKNNNYNERTFIKYQPFKNKNVNANCNKLFLISDMIYAFCKNNVDCHKDNELLAFIAKMSFCLYKKTRNYVEFLPVSELNSDYKINFSEIRIAFMGHIS